MESDLERFKAGKKLGICENNVKVNVLYLRNNLIEICEKAVRRMFETSFYYSICRTLEVMLLSITEDD